MGEVYRARDTRLDRVVAVKILNSALIASPDLKARFEREAKTISQLNHPNICTLFDVGHQDGIDYLVMEFLQGESLADRLKRGPVPVAEVVKIGSEIAEALDRAHRAGIVHRDLKPGNIMLTKSGAKLLDFGLAKPAEAGAVAGSGSAPLISGAMTLTSPTPQQSPLTQQGTLLGTVQYMSPEQVQGKEADTRSDIFAFGSVVYEMATAKRPFEGKSQIKVASAILEDEPLPITSITPALPIALENLVSRMLAKDPDQRWQCAADIKAGLTLVALPAPKAAAARSALWKRLVPWAVAILGCIVALAVFLFRPTLAQQRRTVAYLVPPGELSFETSGDRAAPPVLSPDGTKIVFGAGGKLWLRRLDQDDSRALEESEGATFPFWSPDSKSIGLFQAGKLRTLDVEGGGLATLCDAVNARGGSWSSAGFILFAPNIQSPIMKVALSGGTPVPVSTLKTGVETTHRWPQVLPDGKHFIYFASSHTHPFSDDAGMYAASIERVQSVRVLHIPNNAVIAGGKLLFLRGTTLLAQDFDLGNLRLKGEPAAIASNVAYDVGVWRGIFSVSETGVLVYSGGDPSGHRLLWFSAAGQPEQEVSSAKHSYYSSVALSPKGTRIAETIDPTADLWVTDLNGGGRIRLTADRTSNPVWSPDERQVAYAHIDDSGVPKTLVRAADGTGNEQVLSPEPIWQTPTDWSPDGRYILYDRGDPGTAHVWAMTVAAAGRPFPVAQTESWERDGHFSPDGNWVVFTSRESGADQVYVTRFPGPGPKWQVSVNGGVGPRWSADGRWISYWNGAQNVLIKRPISIRNSKPIFDSERNFVNGAVYHNAFSDADYSLSRDGRVVVNRVGEQSTRLTLVMNWSPELKK
jgi:Tol biopolymer transport system component